MNSSAVPFAELLDSVLSGGMSSALTAVEHCGSSSSWRAELLKLVPGRRATIEFTCEIDDKAPVRLIGKLYRSNRRAHRMHQQLSALGSVFASALPLRVPLSRGFDSSAHLVLFEHVQGRDLRHSTDDREPFRLAASWLAMLHGSSTRPLTRDRPPGHEQNKALSRLARLEPYVDAREYRELRSYLELIGDGSSPAAQQPIHHDFYYANMLWDGSTLTAIDFDQLRIGDPAFDLGHFIGHLRVLAYRTTGRAGTHRGLEEIFLESYRGLRSDVDVMARVPMYVAYTLLKLASTEIDRAPVGWQSFASDMACLAVDELRKAYPQAAQ